MAEADVELVGRVLSGDLEGFGELHRRYFVRVVQRVRGILKDPSQAEDTAQDAFVSALRDLSRLNDPSRFYPWLCRIAVNRAIDEKRRSARKSPLDDVLENDEPVAPDSTGAGALGVLLKQEEATSVREALKRLPERQRAAVVLRFFDGLPMRNIAETLGCEEITARTQVFRGLRKLGVLLDPARSKHRSWND